ncbi:MAG: hypothetical protein AAF789_07340 [Bacteroidota bacterium]
MAKIRLRTIICINPDESDKDEIYIKFRDKKIWPKNANYHRLGVDEKATLGLSSSFKSEWVELELWDYDFASKNDFLGTFQLQTTQEPGHYGTVLTNNLEVSEHAEYVLNWEIVAPTS